MAESQVRQFSSALESAQNQVRERDLENAALREALDSFRYTTLLKEGRCFCDMPANRHTDRCVRATKALSGDVS